MANRLKVGILIKTFKFIVRSSEIAVRSETQNGGT